jgi:hypothetical protein
MSRSTVVFLRVTAFADRPKVGGPVRAVTRQRYYMINRPSGHTTHPAAATIIIPSRRELSNRCGAGRVRVPRPSGKPCFASRLATSFRQCISLGVRLKSLWVLNVETAHKTISSGAAIFAAATVVHVAAARAMRYFAIAATIVNLLGGSRGMFSRVPCLSAENAFPVSAVFTISLQPELRNRLRRFAGRANLQFRNYQDSSILTPSTLRRCSFV